MGGEAFSAPHWLLALERKLDCEEAQLDLHDGPSMRCAHLSYSPVCREGTPPGYTEDDRLVVLIGTDSQVRCSPCSSLTMTSSHPNSSHFIPPHPTSSLHPTPPPWLATLRQPTPPIPTPLHPDPASCPASPSIPPPALFSPLPPGPTFPALPYQLALLAACLSGRRWAMPLTRSTSWSTSQRQAAWAGGQAA